MQFNILAAIEKYWNIDETFILDLIVKLKTNLHIVEADVAKAFTWVAGHATEITSDVQAVGAIATKLQGAGIALPKTMISAIEQANVAVTAMNAMVAAANAGADTTSVLIDGYSAAKQAEAAHATAAAALATSIPLKVN